MVRERFEKYIRWVKNPRIRKILYNCIGFAIHREFYLIIWIAITVVIASAMTDMLEAVKISEFSPEIKVIITLLICIILLICLGGLMVLGNSNRHEANDALWNNTIKSLKDAGYENELAELGMIDEDDT